MFFKVSSHHEDLLSQATGIETLEGINSNHVHIQIYFFIKVRGATEGGAVGFETLLRLQLLEIFKFLDFLVSFSTHYVFTCSEHDNLFLIPIVFSFSQVFCRTFKQRSMHSANPLKGLLLHYLDDVWFNSSFYFFYSFLICCRSLAFCPATSGDF